MARQPSPGVLQTVALLIGVAVTSPTDELFLWDEGSPATLPWVTVNDDGRFEITLTVPEKAAAEQHTLSVEGLGSDAVAVTFEVDK